MTEQERLQAQIDTVLRCYYLVADRGTVFDAGRRLMGLKATLELQLEEVKASEAPTRKDLRAIR